MKELDLEIPSHALANMVGDQFYTFEVDNIPDELIEYLHNMHHKCKSVFPVCDSGSTFIAGVRNQDDAAHDLGGIASYVNRVHIKQNVLGEFFPEDQFNLKVQSRRNAYYRDKFLELSEIEEEQLSRIIWSCSAGLWELRRSYSNDDGGRYYINSYASSMTDIGIIQSIRLNGRIAANIATVSDIHLKYSVG